MSSTSTRGAEGSSGCVWGRLVDRPASEPAVMHAWLSAVLGLSAKPTTALKSGMKMAPPPTPEAVATAPTCGCAWEWGVAAVPLREGGGAAWAGPK
jgi:hypothetical protein